MSNPKCRFFKHCVFFFFFKLFIFGCAGSSLLYRLFSSYGKWGLLSSPGSWASLVAEQRFKAPRLQKLWLRLSYSEARGIFPNQGGIEPASPALAARFLTTGPPGKSQHCVFFFQLHKTELFCKRNCSSFLFLP